MILYWLRTYSRARVASGRYPPAPRCRTKNDSAESFSNTGTWTVSYTHLDVYKRQGEDETPDSRSGCSLEQGQRPGDICVDELLVAVGLDVRLVKGSGVNHRVHIAHATSDQGTVSDGPHNAGGIRREQVDADDLRAIRGESAN